MPGKFRLLVTLPWEKQFHHLIYPCSVYSLSFWFQKDFWFFIFKFCCLLSLPLFVFNQNYCYRNFGQSAQQGSAGETCWASAEINKRAFHSSRDPGMLVQLHFRSLWTRMVAFKPEPWCLAPRRQWECNHFLSIRSALLVLSVDLLCGWWKGKKALSLLQTSLRILLPPHESNSEGIVSEYSDF